MKQHGHTPETYTAEFDAIVEGVRRFADPDNAIQFVGMNLPNIDDTEKVVSWTNYFLNASHHSEAAQNAVAWIGYHAYPVPISRCDHTRWNSKARLTSYPALPALKARVGHSPPTFGGSSLNDFFIVKIASFESDE